MKELEHAGIVHQFPTGIGEGQLPGQHLVRLPGAQAEAGLRPKNTLKHTGVHWPWKVRMVDAQMVGSTCSATPRPLAAVASASFIQLAVRRH